MESAWTPQKADFLAAAEAAEFAANAPNVEAEMVAMTQLLRHQRTIELCLTKQRMEQFAHAAPGHERLPLMDEDGYEYGRVVARVPEDLFFGLEFQKDFGVDAFHSEEGIRDLCKAFPVCRTKTVSGKTTVSMSGTRRERVKFGRGTIKFAT